MWAGYILQTEDTMKACVKQSGLNRKGNLYHGYFLENEKYFMDTVQRHANK